MSNSDLFDKMTVSAADIDSALKGFSESARLFSSNHPRMIDEYENKWVGVYRGTVAAVADTLEELTEQIVKKSIPPAETIVRHVERKEKTLIL